jgi:archaemetzincin
VVRGHPFWRLSSGIEGSMKAVFSIALFFIIAGGGYFPPNSEHRGSKNMERKIILLPIGQVEGWVLDDLERDLEKTFSCKVERRTPVNVPNDSLNPGRGQYDATRILNELPVIIKGEAGQRDIILGITDVDLYAGGLNFVFGEAEPGGRFAVISLARLHQSFYSFPENKTVFLERARKEAVHELGHVFGLAHCSNPACVMYFSNSLLDTDKKSASFCSRCRARLEELMN